MNEQIIFTSRRLFSEKEKDEFVKSCHLNGYKTIEMEYYEGRKKVYLVQFSDRDREEINGVMFWREEE